MSAATGTYVSLFEALTEHKQKKVLEYMRRIDRYQDINEQRFEDVEEAASEVIGVDVSVFYQRTRKREYCVRRQVLWHIMYAHCKLPCAQIGQRYGYDHTSVLHGSALIETLYGSDAAVKDWVDRLLLKLKKTLG